MQALREELSRNPHHKFLKCMGLNNDMPIEFIGMYQGFPIAYAAFEICPCGLTLMWRHLYIPKQLRKTTRVGLTFIKNLCILCKRVYKDCTVEIYLHSSDDTLETLARRYGVKPLYQVGVTSLGKITER